MDNSENNEALVAAAEAGDLAKVRVLIPVCDPDAISEDAMLSATYMRHIDVICELLPHCTNTDDDNFGALDNVAAGGDIDTMRLMLEYCDPKARNSSALGAAAASGNLEMVRFLMPLCDAEDNMGLALQVAAEVGHVEAMRELIPWTNSVAHIGQALIGALNEHTWEVIPELSSHCSDEVLQKALSANTTDECRDLLKAEIESRELHSAVGDRLEEAPSRKRRKGGL